jgi:hypothetical protein
MSKTSMPLEVDRTARVLPENSATLARLVLNPTLSGPAPVRVGAAGFVTSY